MTIKIKLAPGGRWTGNWDVWLNDNRVGTWSNRTDAEKYAAAMLAARPDTGPVKIEEAA